jgi:CHASE3 domain sensor protein
VEYKRLEAQIAMSNSSVSNGNHPQVSRNGISRIWRNLKIGRKLSIGFGILVIITLVVVGWSYFGSAEATNKINLTEDLRVPTALDAASAQANLLRMLASTRGYLALGDQKYRDDYSQAQQAFEADLAKLRDRSVDLDNDNRRRLEELETLLEQWSPLPNELFDLRDDQLRREPALQILLEDASDSYSGVLRDINGLIEIQVRLTASADEIKADDIELLKDMVNFQFSFAQMISGLRGYVSTRRIPFKGEYETQFRINEAAWERLTKKRDQMPSAQQLIFDSIAANREAFLEYPPQMFEILEDPEDRWRVDLYRFRTEAVPLTTDMLNLLDGTTEDQQTLLQSDLKQGRSDLTTARIITLVGGGLAVVLGGVLAYIFQVNIAGAVVRLTRVAERIRGGDLEAQAAVESGDEIGTLAATFNNMTRKLRDTLNQVRKEKRRADDLLEVVIPIGVDLASEKDFNRLLEKMLLEAKSFCHADAGVLYWRTEDDRLEFVIVRNDTLNIARGGTTGEDITYTQLLSPLPLYDKTGEANHDAIATHVALTGTTLNIPHIDQQTGELQFSGTEVFGQKSGYRATSHLAIPLKNSEDHVIGVLQLINAEDPETDQIIPFDQNLQQMMESFSSLAVAALEAYVREQRLKQEIQQLRIEIDEVKRQREVSKIIEADEFKTLKARAKDLRRRRQAKQDKPSGSESD